MLIEIDTENLEKACSALVKSDEGLNTVTIVITRKDGNCIAYTSGKPDTNINSVVEGLKTCARMMELPRIPGLPMMERGN